MFYEVLTGLALAFTSFVMFDWARIWWYARRHGYIMKGYPPGMENVWRNAYPAYKAWSVFIAVAALAVASLHLLWSVTWLFDLVVAVS